MSTREVFVVSAARTAIGTFGGSLKDTPLSDLATTAVRAALERSGAPADAVKDLAGRVEATSKRIVGSVQQLDARIERLREELTPQESGQAKGIHAAMAGINRDVTAMATAAQESEAVANQLDGQARDLQGELARTQGGLQRALQHADGFLSMSEQLIETIAE